MQLPAIPSRYLYNSIAALALVGLFFFGKSCYDAAVVEKAALVASQKHLVEQYADLQKQIKTQDELIQHDTVVLSRAVTRYVTLRDTINIRDTVQVKVALERCDSVVAAVGPTIASLTAGIKTRDRALVNRDSVISVLNARFPTQKAQIVNDAKWALIGAGVDELYHAFKRRR